MLWSTTTMPRPSFVSVVSASYISSTRAGARPEAIPHMLGPLLRSVAENVEALGMPGALTGPVRRGDPAAVQKHRAVIASLAPSLTSLYEEVVRAQIPLARRLGDAPASAFDTMEQSLDHADPSAHQH